MKPSSLFLGLAVLFTPLALNGADDASTAPATADAPAAAAVASQAADVPAQQDAQQDTQSPAPSAAPTETPLTLDAMTSLLGQELKGRFNLDGDLVLEAVNPWTPPDRFATAWRVSVIDYPVIANSSMLIRFRIYADGSPVQDATVLFRANLWRDTWFATQPVQAGTPFDASYLETRRIDGFRARDALPVNVAASGYIFSRSVQPGSMLTWHDVSRRPLVRKGEMVEVSAVDGMLRVTMKAMALESGTKGDIVSVRNPETLRTIPTLVVAENQVEIRF